MTVLRCTHRGGWAARTRGEARCRDCGTVRFTDYGALRPPGLPDAATPPRRTALAADRAAAQQMARITRRPVWWAWLQPARQ
ncbi:hypothetical protein GO001_03535 [Streptomyces sp. NRRL B-1677]|uniref:DUF6255 family natural product biosynthesis protein n=1 Tax=Streptomyces sp. NRRL B-1677 TaxID=2682966 RepID=UPI001892C9EA|nr:DUF6255 family natural product biosynthesis protein [Streptomyces sp. NRRL B-1677]MBF6044293.1 hypothetical protein [Streptomyces sp. NRRL B-1677]